MTTKTTLNNEDVTIGNERRCEETPATNNSPGRGDNTPTIDFDDWVEDPFALAKENDVFSSFASDEVGNSNRSPSDFVSEKGIVLEKGIVSEKSIVSERDSTAPDNHESKVVKKNAESQSLEEDRPRSTSQNVTSSTTAAGVSLKTTPCAKKRSDYIPISRRKRKPKGMPKRPLSAYNLYFQAERTKIIAKQVEGKPRIGFESLGKIIGKQWQDLGGAEKKEYGKLAEKDSERYRKEMDAYQDRKAKRFAEEDRRAAEQSPVLTTLGASNRSVQASFDPNFIKQQGSLRVVPVGEIFGSSMLLSHPPDSMISSVSSQPSGAAISYRPIQIEQAPSPPRNALPYNNILDSRHTHRAVQADPPSHYFPQPPGAHTSEPYDVAAPVPGAAILSAHNSNCPMPPGMEVVLADRNGVERKYCVQYTCYSMTRENANMYVESVTKGPSNTDTPMPWSPPTIKTTTGSSKEYGEWGYN